MNSNEKCYAMHSHTFSLTSCSYTLWLAFTALFPLPSNVNFCGFFSSFLTHLSSFILPLYYLLQENQRMKQNIDCITKEGFDLQETINWKDKKIGVGNKYGGTSFLLILEVD